LGIGRHNAGWICNPTGSHRALGAQVSTIFVFVGLAIGLYGAASDLGIVWRWLLGLLLGG